MLSWFLTPVSIYISRSKDSKLRINLEYVYSMNRESDLLFLWFDKRSMANRMRFQVAIYSLDDQIQKRWRKKEVWKSIRRSVALVILNTNEVWRDVAQGSWEEASHWESIRGKNLGLTIKKPGCGRGAAGADRVSVSDLAFVKYVTFAFKKFYSKTKRHGGKNHFIGFVFCCFPIIKQFITSDATKRSFHYLSIPTKIILLPMERMEMQSKQGRNSWYSNNFQY